MSNDIDYWRLGMAETPDDLMIEDYIFADDDGVPNNPRLPL
jgi:hypothetical protein